MSRSPFPSLRVAGGLLPPDLFARVLDDADLPGREPSAYGLAPHETVREAASRAFDYLRGAWQAFTREREKAEREGRPLTGLTRERWLRTLFRALDFGILPTTPAGGLVVDEKAFPVSHTWEHVPVHLLGWGTDLDRRTKGVTGAASSAPQSLMQELLNRSEAQLWAIVSNGQKLRLLRDSRSLAGSAYVEFDLELIFDGQLFPDFVLLFRLVHASRFAVPADEPITSCWLERWRTTAVEQGERAAGEDEGGLGAVGRHTRAGRSDVLGDRQEVPECVRQQPEGEQVSGFAAGSLVRTRGREWVVLPDPDPELLLVRPLGGSDDEIAGILTGIEEVTQASFPPPLPDDAGNAVSAGLLRTALQVGYSPK